jgi:hypothetical protein
LLEIEELTILTSWSEAVAEALSTSHGDVEPVLADAHAHAPWRAGLGLGEPSAALTKAIESMASIARSVTGAQPTDELLLALRDRGEGDQGLERLVVRVLRSALEERVTRDVTGPAV